MKNKKETNPALPQYVLAVKEIKNAIIDSRYRAARQELPGLTGFSETNIKNMRIFYEAWCQILDNQSISYSSINDIKFNDLLNRQTSSADLNCLFQTHQNQWVFQHIVHRKNYQNASEKHCQVLMI